MSIFPLRNANVVFFFLFSQRVQILERVQIRSILYSSQPIRMQISCTKGGWKVDWLQDSWVRSCQERWIELWSPFRVFQHIFNFNANNNNPLTKHSHRQSYLHYGSNDLCLSCWVFTFFFSGSTYVWNVQITL